MVAKAPITLIHILLLLKANNAGYHPGQKLPWINPGIIIHKSVVAVGPAHLSPTSARAITDFGSDFILNIVKYL